jgi:hypothetical protein
MKLWNRKLPNLYPEPASKSPNLRMNKFLADPTQSDSLCSAGDQSIFAESEDRSVGVARPIVCKSSQHVIPGSGARMGATRLRHAVPAKGRAELTGDRDAAACAARSPLHRRGPAGAPSTDDGEQFVVDGAPAFGAPRREEPLRA